MKPWFLPGDTRFESSGGGKWVRHPIMPDKRHCQIVVNRWLSKAVLGVIDFNWVSRRVNKNSLKNRNSGDGHSTLNNNARVDAGGGGDPPNEIAVAS